jgi:hypothetical protein
VKGPTYLELYFMSKCIRRCIKLGELPYPLILTFLMSVGFNEKLHALLVGGLAYECSHYIVRNYFLFFHFKYLSC